VETVINDYISRELVLDPALLPLADETSLLDSGILDSLSLLRLVVFLEERFGITHSAAGQLTSRGIPAESVPPMSTTSQGGASSLQARATA